MNETNGSRPPLVAIVDDEPDITTFLGLALEDSGFRVVTVNDPNDALAVFRREPPDLICLDLLMPHRTGASLYLEIQRDEQLGAVPVLILSGLNARDELDEILNREGGLIAPAGYLEKPPARETFLEMVRKLLGRTGSSGEGTGK